MKMRMINADLARLNHFNQQAWVVKALVCPKHIANSALVLRTFSLYLIMAPLYPLAFLVKVC